METVKLKELVQSHRERFLARGGLIKRELQSGLEKFYDTGEIVLITGVRRSGKSSLMRLICGDIMKAGVRKENILYVNFDDERFIDFTSADFEVLYETYLEAENPRGKKYFFFDEIQNISGWQRWANRLYERGDTKVFITGSNASMLSSEISTHLTGRNRQAVNWPFSFGEYLKFHEVSAAVSKPPSAEKKAALKSRLSLYIAGGGFPEAVKNNDVTLVEQYYKDIIYRDIISRYALRNSREFKELCVYLSSNIGTICSYENLAKMIHAKNITTVKNYLEYLESAYMFFRLPMFDFSVRRQIYNPGKFYCVDTGMAKVTGFKFSENAGHIYENAVFLELKRRNREIYYWKSKDGHEVDFVCREGMKITEAIQVCLDISAEKAKDREIRGLVEAAAELKVKKLTIITKDEEKIINHGGLSVAVVPMWKWLLKPA
ncbi:MAG: hypothetical protein CVV21_01175 [Candidatus Goldiibacteriota bacterium HGW-Goldbacteria-1]|jgi:hypothetical protein|nr:MAG: hypothetical protein CVV21_01175 [Candidatus Goldiibacteriota bacterium HGW-Goldbacteria-1]